MNIHEVSELGEQGALPHHPDPDGAML